MLNFRKMLLFVWLCIISISTTVNAAVESIGSDQVFIAMPKGYCLLKSSEPSDSRLIKYLEDGNRDINKILMVFADCSQLKSWRIGKLPNLDDYGYVLVPKLSINRKLNMSVSGYLSEMRKVFKKKGVKFLNRNIEKVDVFLEKHFPTVKLNETKNLGILLQDNNALYWGLLQHIQTEEGKSKHMIGMLAMSLVKGRSINFYLWKKYQGSRTVDDLQGLTSLWVATTLGGN